MSRRCDREGVRWPRRLTLDTGDYIAARATSQSRRARLGFSRPAASIGKAPVLAHLRERVALP